jgi:hypothetical protein
MKLVLFISACLLLSSASSQQGFDVRVIIQQAASDPLPVTSRILGYSKVPVPAQEREELFKEVQAALEAVSSVNMKI